MSQFVGYHENTVDSKGRVIIPHVFRKALAPEANGTFVVSKGYEGCLAVRALDDWNKYTLELRRLPSNEKKARQYLRTVVSQAKETKLDRQGRISVPKQLLEYAGIQSQVVVSGVLDKIELWNPKRYEEYMKDADDILEEIAEELSPRMTKEKEPES